MAELTIVVGDQELAVAATGGALRSYRVRGREVLDAFPAVQEPTGARGAVLLPWPNRLRDGRYTWDGRTHQLPINEPDRNTALHGLVTDLQWTLTQPRPDEVSATCRLEARPGYPFALEVAVAYRLDEQGLSVTTTARNAGEAPAPVGIGHHPYLAAPGAPTIDGCELTVPAHQCLPPDERGIPTGAIDVSGSPLDLRAGALLGARRIDATYTDLIRGDAGRAEVVFRGSGGEGRVLWLGEAYRYVHVYTGDTLPPHERRRSVAVEPMTCPPNAFESGVDVLRLEPGSRTTVQWGIRPLDA